MNSQLPYKRQALATEAIQHQITRIARTIAATEGQGVAPLEFPRGAPFRCHRLLVYTGLPHQPAPPEHRLVARNGMKVTDFQSLLNLAVMCEMQLGDFTKEYAALQA